MNLPDDCQKCGACCAVQKVWAEVTEEEAGRIGLPLLQRGDIEPYAMATVDGRCIALEGKVLGNCSCTIYDKRPQVCRDVERGSLLCLYSLGWHKVDLWSKF
jgi:Fe-S-cluster containining protein